MNFAVIILGNRNSGKSSTWYKLFGRRVNSGIKFFKIDTKTIKFLLKNSSFQESGGKIEEFIDVHLQNTSCEENRKEISQLFDIAGLPKVLFISVQYSEHGIETINWLKEKGYFLYIQWLNPGYYDKNEYTDFLEFEKRFAEKGIFTKRSGKGINERVEEITLFLIKWFREKKVLNTA